MNKQVAKAVTSNPETRRTSPTRLKVLQVAASLFADAATSGVGVNEIGIAAGLGRGALYYHISSKEDLLYDITTAHIPTLYVRVAPLSRPRTIRSSGCGP